jgi:hypothetical protein
MRPEQVWSEGEQREKKAVIKLVAAASWNPGASPPKTPKLLAFYLFFLLLAGV